MGKKVAPEPAIAKKPARSKYKEMFPELATHQEEMVQRHQNTKRTHPTKRVIQEDSE
jgi:hypothetical protein